MGANVFTHAAPHTRPGIKLQRRHTRQISERFHFADFSLFVNWVKGLNFALLAAYPANAAPTHATTAISATAACSGMARRISFSTPEGEVYGVEPVKFIAR